MTPIDVVENRTSSHLVAYDKIKSAIMKGDYRANERLVETQLAEWLGLSRTPIREALRLLENEGIVQHNAGKGWEVCAITLEDIREIFEIKLVLEAHAAALAAERATQEEREALLQIVERMSEAEKDNNVELWLERDWRFHELLFSCARNQRLKQTLLGLNDQWYRLRIGIMGMTRRMGESLKEHHEIAQSIAAGDAQKAHDITREHMGQVMASVEEVLRGLMFFQSNGV